MNRLPAVHGGGVVGSCLSSWYNQSAGGGIRDATPQQTLRFIREHNISMPPTKKFLKYYAYKSFAIIFGETNCKISINKNNLR